MNKISLLDKYKIYSKRLLKTTLKILSTWLKI